MQQIYGIFDVEAGAYPFPPFFASHPAEATRMVKMALENKNSPVAKFPGSFRLMLLGYYDPTTGMISKTSTGVPEITIEVAALSTAEQVVNNA